MSTRRLTLLVIDDDEDVRRALARFLRLHGYDVVAFESAEAWLAGMTSVDAADIDINLPGMSGLELDDQLRRDGRAIPAVFITAHDEARASAANRIVLPKPLDTDRFLEALQRVIASSDGAGPVDDAG